MNVDLYLGHHQARPPGARFERYEWAAFAEANSAALYPGDLDKIEANLMTGKPVLIGGGAELALTLFSSALANTAPAPASVDRDHAACAKALRLAAVGFHVMPKIGEVYAANHRTAHAAALITIQAALARLENRAPEDTPDAGPSLLERCRDALDDLLYPTAGDHIPTGRVMQANRVLAELISIVGPRRG